MPRRAISDEVVHYEDLLEHIEYLQEAIRLLDEDLTDTLDDLEEFYLTTHPTFLGRIAQWWRNRNKEREPRLQRIDNQKFRELNYVTRLKQRRDRDRTAKSAAALSGLIPKGR